MTEGKAHGYQQHQIDAIWFRREKFAWPCEACDFGSELYWVCNCKKPMKESDVLNGGKGVQREEDTGECQFCEDSRNESYRVSCVHSSLSLRRSVDI